MSENLSGFWPGMEVLLRVVNVWCKQKQYLFPHSVHITTNQHRFNNRNINDLMVEFMGSCEFNKLPNYVKH